jgi:hypothetical protein
MIQENRWKTLSSRTFEAVSIFEANTLECEEDEFPINNTNLEQKVQKDLDFVDCVVYGVQ